jgi:hypothetical protein
MLTNVFFSFKEAEGEITGAEIHFFPGKPLRNLSLNKLH